MNPPAEKVVPKLSGDLGRYVIPNYIIKTYDGKLIDDHIDKCERCGSRHLQKHGARRKLFCTVVLESGFESRGRNCVCANDGQWHSYNHF